MGTIRDHPEVSMSMPATTPESLRRLETLYSQGYQSEVVDQALRGLSRLAQVGLNCCDDPARIGYVLAGLVAVDFGGGIIITELSIFKQPG